MEIQQSDSTRPQRQEAHPTNITRHASHSVERNNALLPDECQITDSLLGLNQTIQNTQYEPAQPRDASNGEMFGDEENTDPDLRADPIHETEDECENDTKSDDLLEEIPPPVNRQKRLAPEDEILDLRSKVKRHKRKDLAYWLEDLEMTLKKIEMR
ncbi:hypothetical protein Trihar35433_3221 [Trichoderma harzianum]|nr:hypothetical protein Trihar35433_3221 [Trichoderma harzianum]